MNNNYYYHLKYDKYLTKQCKLIFGEEIVKNAYLCILQFDDKNKYYFEEMFLNIKKGIKLDNNCIDYDGNKIIIEFVNENYVLFTNSEWGDITKITNENLAV